MKIKIDKKTQTVFVKKIVSHFFLVLLVSFNGTVQPLRDSQVKKGLLGTIGAIGVGALGYLGWNGSYYSAKDAVESADEHEESARQKYASILRMYDRGDVDYAVLAEINNLHTNSGNHYNLRDTFSVLWFVDSLSTSVNTLSSDNQTLIGLKNKMSHDQRYYTKELCVERIRVQKDVSLLLHRLQSLLTFVQKSPVYLDQQYTYQVKKEEKQIKEFDSALHSAENTLSAIASDSSYEWRRFRNIRLVDEFEDCLRSIFDACSYTLARNSTDKLSYRALWYEHTLINTIYQLQNTYDSVVRNHSEISKLPRYRTSYNANIEHRYNNFVTSAQDQLYLLRDIKSRLLNSHIYYADMSAYNLACRERDAREREERAKERERNARDREYRAREQERAAIRAKERARNEQREFERQKREELEAREREVERREWRVFARGK